VCQAGTCQKSGGVCIYPGYHLHNLAKRQNQREGYREIKYTYPPKNDRLGPIPK